MKDIQLGRWIITEKGIHTIKDQDIYDLSIDDLWSYETKGNSNIYDAPVHICSKGWVSNMDLLDFNSAFLVFMELFYDKKPQDFPNVSWSETLRRQYKRMQYSVDINSFEGRKLHEYQQEYIENLSYEELFELSKIDLDAEPKPQPEVYGDENSRKY